MSAKVNLEVEMAADADCVAGLAHGADQLAGVDALSPLDLGPSGHVGVEVAAPLPFAVNKQVVAVEDWVVAAAQHPAAAHCYQWRTAGGDDVKALVDAAAAAGGAEFTDVAAGAVWALDRENVVVVGDAAVGRGAGGSWCGRDR